MAVTTTNDFLAICRKSELLTEEQLAEVQNWTEQTDEPKRVAATLAKREWVTRWQAHQLLNGRSTFKMGKYKLIDLLGRRGMGNVFLSQHMTMNRRVCLKIVSKKIGQDPQLLKRFLDEARAIATLDHENIVRAYSVDKEGDCFYIVMEYVQGKDLQEVVLQDGPLESAAAAAYIQQAADGLAHAHEKGLIHGDVKPSSLVVNSDGVVKILDVGISEFTFGTKDDSGEQKQLDPTAVNCLAPELTGDSPQPDPRSDIYSLGCTLYFLLTGRPPFPEGTALERMEKHRSETPEPIVKLRPEVSKNLAKVCHKMMAKNPDERFKSAEAVQRVLAEVSQLEQTNRRKSADVAAPPPPRDSDRMPAAAVAAKGKAAVPAQPKKSAVDPKKTPAAAAATPAKSAEKPAASKQSAAPAAKKQPGGKPDFNFLAEPASGPVADVPAIQIGGKRKKKAAPAAATAAVAAAPRAKAKAAAPQAAPAAAPAEAPGPKQPSFLHRNKKWVIIGGAAALGLLLLAVAIPLAVYALSGRDKDSPAVAVEDSATGNEPASALIDDEGSVPDRDDEGSSVDRDDEGGSSAPDDEGATSGDGGTAVAPTEQPGDTGSGGSETATEPGPDDSPDSGTDGGTPETTPDDTTPDDSGGEAGPTDPPAGETPPAEPEPEEKEPAAEKPPEEPPKEAPPAKPKEPFKGFQPSVTLLAADAEGGDAPQKLAAVDVGADSIWFVSLVGGEDVGKGKKLTLDSNREDGPKQRWTLQLETPAVGQREATTAEVANLWWEAGNLVLQWTKESESATAGAIRSCLFDITVEEDTRTLSLFEPMMVEPLVIGAQKPLPAKIEFDEMPNRDKLKLEVTRFEGISEPIEKQPNGPIAVGEPLLLKILFTDAFNNRVPGIAFEVRFATVRDTLTINQRVAGSIADDPMVKQMRVKFPLNEQARSFAQSQISKFDGQIKKRKDEQGKMLRGDALAQRQNGMRFFDNLIKFDDLLKSFNENTKIHYRLYVDVEGREVDVARTEAAKPGGGGKKT